MLATPEILNNEAKGHNKPRTQAPPIPVINIFELFAALGSLLQMFHLVANHDKSKEKAVAAEHQHQVNLEKKARATETRHVVEAEEDRREEQAEVEAVIREVAVIFASAAAKPDNMFAAEASTEVTMPTAPQLTVEEEHKLIEKLKALLKLIFSPFIEPSAEENEANTAKIKEFSFYEDQEVDTVTWEPLNATKIYLIINSSGIASPYNEHSYRQIVANQGRNPTSNEAITRQNVVALIAIPAGLSALDQLHQLVDRLKAEQGNEIEIAAIASSADEASNDSEEAALNDTTNSDQPAWLATPTPTPSAPSATAVAAAEEEERARITGISAKQAQTLQVLVAGTVTDDTPVALVQTVTQLSEYQQKLAAEQAAARKSEELSQGHTVAAGAS